MLPIPIPVRTSFMRPRLLPRLFQLSMTLVLASANGLRRPSPTAATTKAIPRRPFTTTPSPLGPKPLPPRPTIVEGDITEAFLKGTGPGGQKINKTSSAVQLKHLPTGIVVKCQETRSRSQNRKIARRILAERIEDLELGDASRSALKKDAAMKKKASKAKKANRKYRKLAEEKDASSSGAAVPVDHADQAGQHHQLKDSPACTASPGQDRLVPDPMPPLNPKADGFDTPSPAKVP